MINPWKEFSQLCILICISMFLLFKKSLLQWLHIYGFSPVRDLFFYIKITFPCESFMAMAALIRYLLSVSPHIHSKYIFQRKHFKDNCIDKFSLQCVSLDVYQEFLFLWKICHNGCSDKVSLQCDSSCVSQDSIK